MWVNVRNRKSVASHTIISPCIWISPACSFRHAKTLQQAFKQASCLGRQVPTWKPINLSLQILIMSVNRAFSFTGTLLSIAAIAQHGSPETGAIPFISFNYHNFATVCLFNRWQSNFRHWWRSFNNSNQVIAGFLGTSAAKSRRTELHIWGQIQYLGSFVSCCTIGTGNV